jgi:hypothetical protein
LQADCCQNLGSLIDEFDDSQKQSGRAAINKIQNKIFLK